MIKPSNEGTGKPNSTSKSPVPPQPPQPPQTRLVRESFGEYISKRDTKNDKK